MSKIIQVVLENKDGIYNMQVSATDEEVNGEDMLLAIVAMVSDLSRLTKISTHKIMNDVNTHLLAIEDERGEE